jgi:hypothetical protein
MGGKGSGGHNKKSVALHKLVGTYRRDRHGDGLQSNRAARKREQLEAWLQFLKKNAAKQKAADTLSRMRDEV